jgi:FAD/FMN-containing dehydrogenase
LAAGLDLVHGLDSGAGLVSVAGLGSVAGEFLRELAKIVGPDHVLTAPDLRAGYEVDWTGRFRGAARAVVRPASTTQVADIVRLCAETGIGLVPQGGNTGLVAGAVPEGGAIVLSTRRLRDIGAVDPISAQVTVGAGVTIARVQELASEAGFAFGVDLASRDSATVGGTIATNAGGTHVLRHGSMGRQVAGLGAVLADGSVVNRTSGLPKDGAGYDLPALIVGSEGTLAVITEARLRLVPRLRRRAAAWIAVESVGAAVELAVELRQGLESLNALEYLDDAAVSLAAARHGPRPIERQSDATVLVEVAANRDPTPELVDALSAATGVLDAVIASDEVSIRRLWAFREGVAEAISAEGIPHKLDVAVPLDRLATFEDGIKRIVRERGSAAEQPWLVVFGHLAEGNLHVDVLGVDPDDAAIDDAILQLVVDLGGSVSAEHGIGRAKRRWLTRARDAADYGAMLAIKRALDPKGILNPGAMFPG